MQDRTERGKVSKREIVSRGCLERASGVLFAKLLIGHVVVMACTC